jgi:hypothetical protein
MQSGVDFSRVVVTSTVGSVARDFERTDVVDEDILAAGEREAQDFSSYLDVHSVFWLTSDLNFANFWRYPVVQGNIFYSLEADLALKSVEFTFPPFL